MNIEDELVEDIPITIPFKTPPPPPPVQAPLVIEIIDDKDEKIEDEIISSETDQDVEVLEMEDVEVLEIDEPEEISFIVIEDVPVFPGCENAKDKGACFQEMMKNIFRKIFDTQKLLKKWAYREESIPSLLFRKTVR